MDSNAGGAFFQDLQAGLCQTPVTQAVVVLEIADVAAYSIR